MSILNELISERCPHGVVYKPLGDVLLQTKNIKWPEHPNEEYQYIDLTSVNREGHFIEATETIDASNAPSRAQQIVATGDVLFGATRPTLMRYCEIPAEYDGQIASTGYAVFRMNTKVVLGRFVMHCLGMDEFMKHLELYQKGSAYPAISMRDLKKYRIPLPPIEVQREVVRILDEYTMAHDELVRQLEHEMALREQQLSIARNQLLTFTENERVRWATLGELGSFYGGLTGKTKKDFGSGMPFVTYMQVYTNAAMPLDGFERVAVDEGEHQNAVAMGDVLITISSENIEDAGMTCVVTHDPDEETYLNSFCTGWRPNDADMYHPEFLKHLLRSDAVRAQIRRSANGVTRFNISKPRLAKTRLPIPPMEYQLAATEQLDALTSAIEQVSAAIEAERELLAMCLSTTRNLILSFPEKVA